MSKKLNKRTEVLKEYPNAKVIKFGNEYQVWSDIHYLGKGGSPKQAFSAAYNQNIK